MINRLDIDTVTISCDAPGRLINVFEVFLKEGVGLGNMVIIIIIIAAENLCFYYKYKCLLLCIRTEIA